MCNIFENYEELLESNSNAVQELLNEKGTGKWQESEIYFYDDIESFAEYELMEGWYADLNMDRDFKGAPSPIDYIDLKALGKALVNSWDDTCNFITKDGEILSTSYGW